jgi:murein DD-endopeptidase MepM/ murein hydrolase activator NlpD
MPTKSEKSNWVAWKERMEHTYRLIIMNNETFEEVGSYRLSVGNFWVLLSTIFVLVAILISSLIVFTPLATYIPGYASGPSREEVNLLYEQVSELEKQLDAQSQYTYNVRKMLVGEVETAEEVKEKAASFAIMDSIKAVERNEADKKLRQEVERESGRVDGVQLLENVSPLSSAENIPMEKLYLVAPVNGEISARFMPGDQHFGVDILAPKNTPVKATMDGYVFLSDWTIETGNTIGIQHSNNMISFYKHNSVLLKKVGSYVKAGEAVAIIGDTGDLSDGPHLHFEMWRDGSPIDPTAYINF